MTGYRLQPKHAAMPKALPASEAHVWYMDPDAPLSESRCNDLLALLSPDEHTKCLRFHSHVDRQRYLVSHSMVRILLSQYLGGAPAGWRFTYSEKGRPELADRGLPPLRFNLTHTRGLAACIVTSEDDCGIDAEWLSPRHNPAGVAARYFSAEENMRLSALEGEAWLEYFYSCWTLREAYVKARGIGLNFPLHQLNFIIAAPESIRMKLHPDIEDDAGRWDFRLFRPTATHILAAAYVTRNGAPKTVRVKRFSF
jgi:4'-phosphopantetheinyl transferase